MTNFALWFLVIFAAMTAGEGYLLLGRIRVFINHAENLLAVGENNVAKQPGKSAPRTAADDTPTGPIDAITPTDAAEDEWRERFGLKPSPRPRSAA